MQIILYGGESNILKNNYQKLTIYIHTRERAVKNMPVCVFIFMNVIEILSIFFSLW